MNVPVILIHKLALLLVIPEKGPAPTKDPALGLLAVR